MSESTLTETTPATPRPKRRRRWLRRMSITGILLSVTVGTGAGASPFLLHGATEPMAVRDHTDELQVAALSPPRDRLRVVSLNVAHGRGNGFHQLLQRRGKIEQNLDAISGVLVREQPHLVGLQEADGPSRWSGRFDHVAYLARASGFGYSARAAHVSGVGLSYGTAFLATVPLRDSRQFTFRPSPPTFPKGFMFSTVRWPGSQREIEVVSVHLDFARKAVRRRQLERMREELSPRERPLIVMGDFNCQWADKDGMLRAFAEGLGLSTHEPEQLEDLVTFPGLTRRLDWILVSPELEIERYEVLSDEVSDHRGVVTELRWVGE